MLLPEDKTFDQKPVGMEKIFFARILTKNSQLKLEETNIGPLSVKVANSRFRRTQEMPAS